MTLHTLEQTHDLLATLTDPAASPPTRAAAARALATAGDPRPGVGVHPDGVPDIAWIAIPAGAFVYGERERIMLDAFAIARYPITVAQFDAFIDAPDGFRNRRWWHGLPLRDYVPDRAIRPPANHPVERVSWCAAIAFTRWLSARTGATIRLPTEQQWEKAARGPNGRRYPWGDRFASDCANLNETAHRAGPYYLERTTAVGLYPAGTSPFGVDDLIGNVWEWCLNAFHDPDACELYSDTERVMRGGAWSCAPDVCALTRDLDLPEFGYDGVGFRVVRVADS